MNSRQRSRLLNSLPSSVRSLVRGAEARIASGGEPPDPEPVAEEPVSSAGGFVPDDLNWQSVHSSNVERVAYQDDFRRLWIGFKASATQPARTYMYFDVPKGIYEGLLAAPSKGTYVWSVVRNKGQDNVYGYQPV